MCGIFGIWHLDGKPVDLLAVQHATTTLRHRGPDDEGYLLVNTRTGGLVAGGEDTDPRLDLPPIETYSGETFDLVFGHRRLAIIDLSPAGHQPMASSDGSLWIVYNGEIYNYLELRSELEGHGYKFHTDTDTEVILVAYQRWGPECLAHFNGMWAFCLWDSKEQRLFLTRDRFGVKPLYYVHKGDRFAFASEIKGLVGKHGWPFEPEDDAIYHYLVGGYLPSPQRGGTFFEGVQSVPPGHRLIVRPSGATTLQRYWTLPLGSDEGPRQRADVVAGYGELFTDSVRLRLRADVPIGTCLSGGVDSSSIVCVVNRLMAQGGLTTEQIGCQQKTFSAVYRTAGPYNERAHIEKVLEATGAEGNFVFPTAERLRQDVERLVWHQEEPFQTTSMFAQWCVMSKVRERGVTVLLDGQGADEALAGYRPFEVYLGDVLSRDGLWSALQEARAIQSITGLSTYRLWGKSMLHQLPPLWIGRLRRQRDKWRTDQAYLHPDFADRCHPLSRSDWWDAAARVTLSRHLRTLFEESILPYLLRYEDRNSMAFSIEGRVPFLDYRLVEYSFGAAAPWRIYQGWTKWVLRQAMDGVAPSEVIWRRDKVGFETPEAEWLLHWLRTEQDAFPLCTFSSDYLDSAVVRQRIEKWMTTGQGDTRAIWRWINLELWLRIWSAI